MRKKMSSIIHNMFTVYYSHPHVQSYVQLVERYQGLLDTIKTPLCLVLDSLDQLRDQGRNLKEWIPEEVDPNVWVLLSTITGEGFTIEESLKVGLLHKQLFIIDFCETSQTNQHKQLFVKLFFSPITRKIFSYFKLRSKNYQALFTLRKNIF